MTPSGAARTEISAAISGGMSGGPPVDNTTGQVVGLNDFSLSGENQPFNFVTDAAALRAFLVKNSVQLVTPAAPAKPFPWLWVGIGGGLAAVLLVVAPVLLVLRRRAKRRNVPPVDAGQMPQPAPQQAVAPMPPVVAVTEPQVVSHNHDHAA